MAFISLHDLYPSGLHFAGKEHAMMSLLFGCLVGFAVVAILE
jgi:hypothetical protein